MPKVRRLAKESQYRSLAIDSLAATASSENQDYLRSLIPSEMDAGVVLNLLNKTVARSGNDNSGRDARFNEELLRLLNDSNVEVRQSALASIALNWNSTEEWQVRFDSKVSQRVNGLLKSTDADEKRLANSAVEGLKKTATIWLERDKKH